MRDSELEIEYTVRVDGDQYDHEAFREAVYEAGGAIVGEESVESQDAPPLPEPGDVLTDENAPDWSDCDWVEVRDVLPDVRADEYEIQNGTDMTVADANPSYPADDAVILAQYEGFGDWYAFPASRLA